MFKFGNKNKHKFVILQILAIGLIIFSPYFVFGDTNTDIQNQIKQKQAQLDQLNKEIADYQAQVKAAQKQSNTLKNQINIYSAQISSTQIQIVATQTKIDNTNLQIQQTQDAIDQKNAEIAQDKKSLSELLYTLGQMGDSSTIQLTLSNQKFSDFLDQVEYTESIQSKVYDTLQQIKVLKQKLEDDKVQLQANLDQLNQLSNQLSATKATLTDQKSQKANLLAVTKGQEAKYQKIVSTDQQEQQRINQEIYSLDQKIQGKKGFNSLKPIHGILAWPMDGIVTQGYGNTGFTSLGYNFHNGVDIAAPPGTPIYAAADGVVYATGSGQTAYGNWVAIKHTITAAGGHQIITLYGHMRSFVVSGGETVKRGDLVGYEGNTGNTTRLLYGPDRGYHLHFSVFDAVDFGINPGAYQNLYGPYQVPYGYTYNPYDFL